jgi:hypothetical protein
MPDPWAFADWRFAGPGGTFPGRWDDANGRYRVIYACSQRLGAFLETLAQFQADPSIIAEYEAMDVLEVDDDTITPGSVPASWCRERAIAKGVTTEGELHDFVIIGATSTLAQLRKDLASRIVHHGLADLDGATIRMTAPRAFTQEVSSHIQQQRDDEGQPYGGIFYLSRLGDEIANWAIFEQESMNGQSPVLLIDRGTVDPADEDFEAAMRILGLRLVP